MLHEVFLAPDGTHRLLTPAIHKLYKYHSGDTYSPVDTRKELTGCIPDLKVHFLQAHPFVTLNPMDIDCYTFMPGILHGSKNKRGDLFGQRVRRTYNSPQSTSPGHPPAPWHLRAPPASRSLCYVHIAHLIIGGSPSPTR